MLAVLDLVEEVGIPKGRVLGLSRVEPVDLTDVIQPVTAAHAAMDEPPELVGHCLEVLRISDFRPGAREHIDRVVILTRVGTGSQLVPRPVLCLERPAEHILVGPEHA